MTSTATDPNQNATESHVMSEPNVFEAGSPDAGTQVDGAGDELEIEVVGQEPDAEEGAAASAEPTRDDGELERLRAELAERDQAIRDRDEVLDEVHRKMEADPELRKRLSANGSPSDDLVSMFNETIDTAFTPESGQALRQALGPIVERIAKIEQGLGGQRQRLQQIGQAVGTHQFREQLGEQGVSAAEQAAPAFQAHMKRLRGRREFQSLEARSPNFAAEMAASSWKASRAQTNGNADDRRRIASAKATRGGSQPSRGSSTAEKIIRIKKLARGGHVDQAQRIRLEAAEQGKPIPTIEYYTD